RNPTFSGWDKSWVCLDIVGGEAFENVISVIREPFLFLASEFRARKFILIGFPGDSGLLQPLRKSLPSHPTVINLIVTHVDFRIDALMVADGAGPEVAAVGRGAGHDRAVILI